MADNGYTITYLKGHMIMANNHISKGTDRMGICPGLHNHISKGTDRMGICP